MARDKFAIGDRVMPSATGRSQLQMQASARGTIIGFSRHSDCVRVRRDGHKGIDRYHMDFWKRAK